MKSQELTIGVLAKQSGVGVETVRFYEKRGLIRRPPKRTQGFRNYAPDDAKKIRFIKRAQELGFTLKEIKELLVLELKDQTRCVDINDRALKKLDEVEQKIKDLQRIKRSLKRLSSACMASKPVTQRCRVLDCFDTCT